MSEWWIPRPVNADTADGIREDHPGRAYLSDDELLAEYGYEGHEYEQTALWDHLGDAREDYDRLADAYLKLLSETSR